MTELANVLTDKEREAMESGLAPTLTLRGSSRAKFQIGVTAVLLLVGCIWAALSGNGSPINLLGSLTIAFNVLFTLTDLTSPRSISEIPEALRRRAIAKIEQLDLEQASDAKRAEDMDAKTLRFFEKFPHKWPAVVEYQERRARRFFGRIDAWGIIAGTIACGVSGFF